MYSRLASSLRRLAPLGLGFWLACSSGGGVQPRDAGGLSDASATAEAGAAGDAADEVEAMGSGGAAGSSGTLTVNTTCGLSITDACPRDHATDGLCGLEEALLAMEDRKSEYGCDWSGTMGSDDTIVIPTSGRFTVSASLSISRAVTIRSSTAGSLATLVATVGNDMFGVTPKDPIAITFQDLHLIGPGQWLDTLATGLAISGQGGDPGPTINVTRCWIEQFSDGAIVASDVTLNITDSTLDSNGNDYGDGGGGLFYNTGGDAQSQVSFLNINNSSITRNHSTKGGGIQIQANTVSRITNSTVSDNLTEGGHGGGISFANNAGPLAGGVLRIVGSTIAFNGSTENDGAGIAVAANRELFTENVNNRLYLAGSVVANNCLAKIDPDQSFTCISSNDVYADIYLLQDTLLGSRMFSTIVEAEQGGAGLVGVTLLDVDAGLDPTLTDQGGVGEHHPQVHMLNSDSVAIDATDVLLPVEGMTAVYALDQCHRPRGFDHLPAGPKVFDLGAVERRSNP